jgi:kynurenine formamidase
MSDKFKQAVKEIEWQRTIVKDPLLEKTISVIAAKGIPYASEGNRLQNLNIYIADTPETSKLIDTHAPYLPFASTLSTIPRYLVYIHGGAWRDPSLLAGSIEATVACAFANFNEASPIKAIASLNYTLTQFPLHPADPYDAVQDDHSDPGREAVHPDHVSDIFKGLDMLRQIGMEDGSYILLGHSAGACLAFQASLQSPLYYGLKNIPEPPRPAIIAGLNGLYDLPALVHQTDTSHLGTTNDYNTMLTSVYGADESIWANASPAQMEPDLIARRLLENKIPPLIWLDQSTGDQLVPGNQLKRFSANLNKVKGLRVITGKRCKGRHAAPWQQGKMIWDTITDVIETLKEINKVMD